jgi:hypothetical protein
MRRKFSTTILKTGLLMCTVVSVPQIGWAADFDSFSMPVSNPVYNGDARNVTMVRPILLRQSLPDKIKVNIGGTETELNLGGNVQGAALQFSYAFSDRFSLVAVKDGYLNTRPDDTLSNQNGWVDIAAGLQYSFLYDPAQNFIMTGRLVYESNIGSSDVYQGNGSGNLAPSILFSKGLDKLQLSGTVGFVLPFDRDEENTLLYDSWNAAYAVTDWFKPLIELNHFHVLSSGNRNLNGFLSSGKESDLVGAVTTFNGCDVINLGGEYNAENRDLVTMAFGSRFRINKMIDVGVAYEIPLTDDSKSLFGDRIMVDAVFTF